MSWFWDARRGRWDSLGIDSQLGSFTFSSRASVAALRARWGGGRIREQRDLLFFNVAWLAVEGSAMDSRDAGFGSGAIRGACSPVRGADSHGRGLFSAPAARRRGRCHLLSLYSSSILFAFRLSPHSVGGRPDTRVLPPSSAPAAFRELLRRVLGLLRSADPLAFDGLVTRVPLLKRVYSRLHASEYSDDVETKFRSTDRCQNGQGEGEIRRPRTSPEAAGAVTRERARSRRVRRPSPRRPFTRIAR